MSEQCCQLCRFWRRDELVEHHDTGACLRHAPRPTTFLAMYRLLAGANGDPNNTDFLSVENTEACWPTTAEDDWCGEFQPREPQR